MSLIGYFEGMANINIQMAMTGMASDVYLEWRYNNKRIMILNDTKW